MLKNYKIYHILKGEKPNHFLIEGLITDEREDDKGRSFYIKRYGKLEKRTFGGSRVSLITPELEENEELKGKKLLMLCLAQSPKISKENDDEYTIVNTPLRDYEGKFILLQVPDEMYHDNVSSLYLESKCVYTQDFYADYNIWRLRVSETSSTDRWDWSE